MKSCEKAYSEYYNMLICRSLPVNNSSFGLSQWRKSKDEFSRNLHGKFSNECVFQKFILTLKISY